MPLIFSTSNAQVRLLGVKLITSAVSGMAADKNVGRAHAMRQSMLAMVEKGKLFEAHPAFWAPFVVVDEGAAR